MKKLIIICLCVFMLTPLVAQESKLKMIKGTWEKENRKTIQIRSGILSVYPFIDAEGNLPILLKFQDNKCVVINDIFGVALEVEEGEEHVYVKMADKDKFFVFRIVDSNTIALEISKDTIIYKRKQK